VVPAGHGQAARALSIVVLLAVASGWRPRLTAIPHWYVAWSLLSNASILDGGDQITAVLALLLIPVALTDPRRWHWQPAPEREPGAGRLVAYAALVLIQLQVAVLYFHASIAKLGVREWADGTAMYYWLRNPTFGVAGWQRPIVDLLTGSPVGVAVLTWSSVTLEFSLATALLLRPAYRRRLLVAGLAFHGLIALAMGLVSFSTAMSGALLLYLLPIGHQIAVPRLRLRLARDRGTSYTPERV
jgi:antimicrobial peptide system SdpB family protein